MNHLGGHSVISVQRMLRRFRLITLLVVQHGLLLNEFDFSRAVRQKAIMNARLITPVAGIPPHRLVSQQRLCLPQL